ncbi:MAG TPA: Hsp33 family molecular chaperone HslO [Blastocatellia bacterium]|nr:Hsp33 family molecular chaperone HslO [Blastocatellia bacterium]
MSDHLVHGTAANNTIRLIAAVTTDLVNEACNRHNTSPTASAALGRLLTGALLLGRTFKDLELLTLQVRGDGPLGSATAEASPHGTVRGYVNNPEADLPPNDLGKFDVGGLVKGNGNAMLHVTREAGFEIGLRKEPYIGSVAMPTGEIAEDIAYYLNRSEQINSAVALGVFYELEQAQVTAAGGLLIQAMPDADPNILVMIEDTVSRMPHLTELIRNGADAEHILHEALGLIEFDVLEKIPVEFRCRCSYERAVGMVAALGENEIKDMLEKDKGADLTCGFCNETYSLDEEALRAILAPPIVM